MLSSLFVLAHIAMSSGSDAAAFSAATVATTVVQDADPMDAHFEAYGEAIAAKKFDQAQAAAREIDKLAGSDLERGVAKAMLSAALYGAKKDTEAKAVMASFPSSLAPGSKAHTALLVFCLYAGRPDIAGVALDHLIATDPAAVRELDQDMLYWFLRQEPKDAVVANEDRRIGLARIGYGGDTAAGDSFTANGIRLLLKRGRQAEAIALLPRLDEPQGIEGLLIERRFAALWPDLEKRVGDQLSKVRASSTRSAQLAYADRPDDFERIADVANAFRHAGRLDDAIALKAKLPTTAKGWSDAGEQAGWAANNIAMALHEAGRQDEADALLATLNEAKIEDDSWRISMIINRLELLMQDGKYDRAANLLGPAEKRVETDGSPYAKQLLRRMRFCLNSKQGRAKEAEQSKVELLKNAKDAPGPTVEGLVCAGELDEAENLIQANLSDDDFQSFFVRAMQARPLTSDDPSVWLGGWKSLRGRPAIAQAFERLGRDMPANLVVPQPPQQRR